MILSMSSSGSLPLQLSTSGTYDNWRLCSFLYYTISSPLSCSKLTSHPPHLSPPERSRTKAFVTHAAEDGRYYGPEEEEIHVLTAMRSNYNDIVILDTPKSRMLLLDSSNNVHSIFNKGEKWTGSYWDEFASLPAVVPDGPIAIFGLGGGTAAHLMLELWPSLQLEGWEIDEILIDKAREHLGLSDLEKCAEAEGILRIRIGDALSPSATIPGGYAGIVIDLFSDGRVLPQLQEVATWLEIRDKLMPNGRIMMNCGGACDGSDEETHPQKLQSDGTWRLNSTLQTLYKAFPGQLSWKKMPRNEGENFLALTGPLPDLSIWSAALPPPLSSSVKQWKICSPSF